MKVMEAFLPLPTEVGNLVAPESLPAEEGGSPISGVGGLVSGGEEARIDGGHSHELRPLL